MIRAPCCALRVLRQREGAAPRYALSSEGMLLRRYVRAREGGVARKR